MIHFSDNRARLMERVMYVRKKMGEDIPVLDEDNLLHPRESKKLNRFEVQAVRLAEDFAEAMKLDEFDVPEHLKILFDILFLLSQGYSVAHTAKELGIDEEDVVLAKMAFIINGEPMLDKEMGPDDLARDLRVDVQRMINAGYTAKEIMERTGVEPLILVKMLRKRTYRTNTTLQPCWNCKNAVPTNADADGIPRGCSWSISLKPVEGWTAQETGERSYKIKKCPEFVPEDYLDGYLEE